MAKDKKPPKTATVIVPMGKDFVLEAQVPLSFEIKMSPSAAMDLDEKVQTLNEIDDDAPFSVMLKAVGLDPKKDCAHSNLEGITFTDERDMFEHANLRGTYLMNTVWNEGTSLFGALLEGANMTGAKGLTEEMLATAYINETTTLPDYLDRAKITAMHAAYNMPPAPGIKKDDGMIKFSVPVEGTLHPKM